MKLLSAVYDYGKNEKSLGLPMKWRKKYFKKTRKEKKKIEPRKKSSKQAKTKRKISEISEPFLKLTENRGNDKN